MTSALKGRELGSWDDIVREFAFAAYQTKLWEGKSKILKHLQTAFMYGTAE